MPRLPSTRWLVLRFMLLSVGLYCGMQIPWVQARLVQPYTRLVAMLATAALRVVHPSIRRDGVVMGDGQFSVQLLNVCNGTDILMLFAAAVLAFPCPWRRRALGLLVGLPLLVAVNLLRVGGLFLTGRHLPGLFATSHLFVWQAGLVLVTVVAFAAYLRWAYPRQRAVV